MPTLCGASDGPKDSITCVFWGSGVIFIPLFGSEVIEGLASQLAQCFPASGQQAVLYCCLYQRMLSCTYTDPYKYLHID